MKKVIDASTDTENTPKKRCGRPKKVNPSSEPASSNKEARARLKTAIVEVSQASYEDIVSAEAADAKSEYILALRSGKSKAAAEREIKEKYNLTPSAVKSVMSAASKDLNTEYQTYIGEVAAMNTGILQTIIERAMDTGDYRTAIMATQELSKLAGAYQNNSALKAEVININFGS